MQHLSPTPSAGQQEAEHHQTETSTNNIHQMADLGGIVLAK
jgi:hypothetical protein